MVSYKEALFAVLNSPSRKKIIKYMDRRKDVSEGYLFVVSEYSERSLKKSLDKMEVLGIIHHIYVNAQSGVEPRYSLTAFGKEIARAVRHVSEDP